MARRQTYVLDADVAGIAQAAAILRSGGLVAFPTETVYGLGANALDATAVRGIFAAKARPADDPLIVHLADSTHIGTIAIASDLAVKLGDCFWPGPLTLVLSKRDGVPPEVTAGLDTVAVRVPSHPIARELLKATALPIAAPSANLFGRPSPTRAAHVLHDLDGRIDAIIDGGPTTFGVESTIVDLSVWPPRLLRAGGLAAEDIEAALGAGLAPAPEPSAGPQAAPGMLPVHYSPRTPLTLITGPPRAARELLLREVDSAVRQKVRLGVVALLEDAVALPSVVRVEVVGTWLKPERSAERLFEAIRTLDAENLDLLLVRDLADPSKGIGRALADRLRRAARRILVANT